MLLVLNVVYYGMVAAHVAREIHKSKGWASHWLKRYKEKGLEGLMDRAKRRQTSKGIQTGRIQDKNNFEGEQPRLDNKAG